MAMNKDMTTKQKIEYIKGYYKWHIIIALLVLVAAIFTAVHFLTKEKYDVRVFYAGENYFGSNYSEGIYSLADVCQDVTGDGEVKLLFDQFCYGGLHDPQYLTTMTATLEKMIAKEDDACLILADEGRAKMIGTMSGKYVLNPELWAEGVSENAFLTLEDVPVAVKLSGSLYLREKGVPSDNLYLILLTDEGRNPLVYENAKKAALAIVEKMDDPANADEISAAILHHNSEKYLHGECVAEGHIILTDKNVDGNRVVSLFASYGEYGFQNGNFVKVSGSGAIPCRITFDKNGDVTEYLEPLDGAGYTESVKKMFDEETYAIYEGKKKGGDAYTLCKEGEILYARNYLEKIGRDAKIGEYGDFSYELLTDLGVSVEVSNMLLSQKDAFSTYFPYYAGNAEHIVNGVRYVYAVSYDAEKKEITYAQYEYGKDEPLRKLVFDSVTGEAKG